VGNGLSTRPAVGKKGVKKGNEFPGGDVRSSDRRGPLLPFLPWFQPTSTVDSEFYVPRTAEKKAATVPLEADYLPQWSKSEVTQKPPEPLFRLL
jgi:hypothetical protein